MYIDKFNSWLDKRMPAKPLSDKQRRLFPLLERMLLMFGAGYATYAVAHIELKVVDNWTYAYLVIGIFFVILAGLIRLNVKAHKH